MSFLTRRIFSSNEKRCRKAYHRGCYSLQEFVLNGIPLLECDDVSSTKLSSSFLHTKIFSGERKNLRIFSLFSGMYKYIQ